jgi:hypothetical protein
MRGSLLKVVCVLFAAGMAVPCQAQQASKGKWVFTTESTVNAKGKTEVYQHLTLAAEETPQFKRGKTPSLTLICSNDLVPTKLKFVLSDAGIFNTYPDSSSSLELSNVDLRWELGDGIATSFVRTVWYRMQVRDMLVYGADDTTMRLMFSSETLLLEPSIREGPGGIIRFDIRGLQEHASELTGCAKEVARALRRK